MTPTNVKVTVDGKELDFLSGSELDLAKLRATLERMPSVADMQQWIAKNALIENLRKRDPLLAPLLRWIIGTNRARMCCVALRWCSVVCAAHTCHCVCVSDIRELLLTERMKPMLSPHQFVFLSSSPDKEARFQALKRGVEVSKGKGKGSILAWHGSGTGNWHSILRTGLKNMSGTKYQDNGAAYGQGIYLAVDSQTSFGYCRQSQGWQHRYCFVACARVVCGRELFTACLCCVVCSMFGAQVIILALCEIVNHPDLKPITPQHPYYVVPHDDW